MATYGETIVRVTAYDNLKFSWWRDGDYNIPENYTTVKWSMDLISVTYGTIYTSVNTPWYVNVNGNEYSGSVSVAIGDNQTKNLANGTTRIYHNIDGTKSFNYSFSQTFNMNFNGWVGTISGSGSGTLDTIPRYLDSINIYNNGSSLESIYVGWSCSPVRDYTQYSINGSEWKDAYDSVAADGQSGTFTVSNLVPNTTYSIKVRLRRQDSGLWSESESINITTLDVARFTSIPDTINFGDSFIVAKTNPSGAANILRIEVNNTTIIRKTLTSDYETISLSDTEWDDIYRQFTNTDSLSVVFALDTIGNQTYYDYAYRDIILTGNQKTLKFNVNNNWRRGKVYVKVGNTWKNGIVWTKVNGVWKRGI